MKLNGHQGLVVLLIVLLLPACAAKSTGPLTSIRSAWIDPDHQQQPLGKLLVLGLAKRDEVKKQFETAFAQELQARGVEGVSAYTIMPTTRKVREDRMRAMLSDGGFDHVLVTRLVAVRRQQDYRSDVAYFEPYPWYGGFYVYYGNAWDQTYAPDQRLDNEVVTLETNLYRMSDDKLVWSATSDTFKSHSDADLINSFSREAAIELAR